MTKKPLEAAEHSSPYVASLLPLSTQLPIDTLASSFSSVTNSYKFYWFLSILEEVKLQGERTLPVPSLLARMLSLVWYPVNYFRLSFGKQDRLGALVASIRDASELTKASCEQEVYVECLACLEGRSPSLQASLRKGLGSISRYVPYRFLRPWFASYLRGVKDSSVHAKIVELADASFSEENSLVPLYRFVPGESAIEIHPLWLAYLQQHLRVLQDFCLWNLVSYLNKKNPNTPGIVSKLFAPQARELKQARTFWETVCLHSRTPVTCIYSGVSLPASGFSLDHFLPWSFVAHDLMWNLIPTPSSVNSAKGNRLPCLQSYLDDFCEQQYQAVQVVGQHGQGRQLEDHLLLVGASSVSDLLNMSYESFATILQRTVSPQWQIAENMGFEGGWSLAF